MPLLFAADVVAGWLGAPSAGMEVMAQLAASGLLGLGLINWWWRGNLVGGIYGRPLGLANLLCFLSAAASLGRATQAGTLPGAVWVVVIGSAALALAFAWRMFVWTPQPGPGQRPGV
ncbi:hypothetical protein DKM44_13570 [Deinococcus irradiatisoli]|uniref:Uncharacterized protein n=1 Tax=Deinococcus irradiatisoli TaxID=2202254 RepID=A0A2Z3JJG3_9DEIO|nr:hypothetical protein DKM44_13570 [Deinococcus irradiatisoli]